jgi:hypothetical protein
LIVFLTKSKSLKIITPIFDDNNNNNGEELKLIENEINILISLYGKCNYVIGYLDFFIIDIDSNKKIYHIVTNYYVYF